MKKKSIALLLSLALVCTALTGCGKTDDTTETYEPVAETIVTDTESAADTDVNLTAGAHFPTQSS